MPALPARRDGDTGALIDETLADCVGELRVFDPLLAWQSFATNKARSHVNTNHDLDEACQKVLQKKPQNSECVFPQETAKSCFQSL
jgi:hypothetical protein